MSAEKPYTTQEFSSSLEGLFEFNHPRTYEKHLQEVWNLFLIHVMKQEYPINFTEIAGSIYHLINFLQAAEKVIGHDSESDAV